MCNGEEDMNIYVTGVTTNDKFFKVYKYINDTFSQLGDVVKTPLDTIEFCNTHNDNQRFKKALKEIGEADFVISEISGPSCGEGFELGFLYAKNFKNVVLITSSKDYKSGILQGAYGDPIFYDNNNLNKLLTELKKRAKQYKEELEDE